MPCSPRILILRASIGEGHNLPARVLAEGIADDRSRAQVEIVDALAVVGRLVQRVVLGGFQFGSAWGSRLFDLEFGLVWDVVRISPEQQADRSATLDKAKVLPAEAETWPA